MGICSNESSRNDSSKRDNISQADNNKNKGKSNPNS